MILFDCHAHVYENIVPVAGARYIPEAPAPLAHWLNNLGRNGLKGGIIVQVSFLGDDNSELCRALEQLDTAHYAGVAVVALDVADEELNRLAAVGVKGFRWNLVRGTRIPDLQDPVVRLFLKRIHARDMHLEVHLESPRLAGLIPPLLALGGKVVVDHLGLPSEADPGQDPWLQALAAIGDLSGLYVKLSGQYRTPFPTEPHINLLKKMLLPDRIIWGSDWPHTQHEKTVNFQEVAKTRQQAPITSDCTAVEALYGLQTIS